MNKYIFPIIKWKIKPWLKYYILNKPATSYPLSEITTGTSPLTLTNSIRKKFHLFNVGGNTIQDGTPTPEAPVPVENVSGEVEVKVENKNKFDKDNVIYVNNKILNDSGVEVNDSTGGYTKMYIPVSSSAEWTISGLSTSGAKRIYYFDENKKFISRSAAFTTSYLTFTTPENCKYVDIQYYITGNDFNTYQLEEGSTATSYEPHEEQTATIHLPEGMEMCKIGTYVDIFTKSGSNWIVPNKILKIASYNGETITTPYISSTGGLDIGATVYYVGSEDYLITDPTLISDLESLKNLYSYKGTTHISSSNAPSPVFEVQYYMEGGDV